jgi:hypothetical protein
MTVRFVCSAMVAGLLVTGAVAASRARVHAQDAGVLPSGDAWVTVIGCVQQGMKHRLVLVSPTTERIPGVPESTCNTPVAEPLLELHDTHEYHFDSSLVGHWVEISGRLEHFDRHDDAKNPRELHIRTFRAVPVLPPRVAEIPPARELPQGTVMPSAPAAAPAPAPPEEKPVATTGTTPAPLPNTASPLPLVIATTVMALMGALAFRLFRLRLEGRI